MNWKHKVAIKHLLYVGEGYEPLSRSMQAIADVLDKHQCFAAFNSADFRDLPVGDHILTAFDYANRLLERMYDYADANSIWIE